MIMTEGWVSGLNLGSSEARQASSLPRLNSSNLLPSVATSTKQLF